MRIRDDDDATLRPLCIILPAALFYKTRLYRYVIIFPVLISDSDTKNVYSGINDELKELFVLRCRQLPLVCLREKVCDDKKTKFRVSPSCQYSYITTS